MVYIFSFAYTRVFIAVGLLRCYMCAVSCVVVPWESRPLDSHFVRCFYPVSNEALTSSPERAPAELPATAKAGVNANPPLGRFSRIQFSTTGRAHKTEIPFLERAR